jgi:hypothetical protein
MWGKRVAKSVGYAAMAILALLVGAAGFAFLRYGDVPAHIVARLACPAVFIEGRTTDFAIDRAQSLGIFPFEVASVVRVTTKTDERLVLVRSFGLFESRARYYPQEGCVLE